MSFDLKARDWDKDPQKVSRAKVFADEIVGFLNGTKIDKALEFGSGTGLVSFNLYNRFGKIILADSSSGMTEVLREKIGNTGAENMEAFQIDLLKESLPQSGFDIIYTLLVLHHVHEVEKTLGIFYKLLKKGGYLCIGDLVPEDGTFHHKDPYFDGHRGFDTEEFKVWMKNAGFSVEKYKIFSIIEKEYNSAIKKYPMFLLIGKKN